MAPDSSPDDKPDSNPSDKIGKIDFSTFVLSLSTSALYQLGLVPGPDGETVGESSRALAQQTIDSLEMLSEKTRGNLEEGEKKLLESLLYELRMQFVKAGTDSD
jgi:hypothetical protein